MKKMNKQISAILLTLVVLINVFLMAGCADKNREYDENEVYEAAKKLIPESVILNEIYYGYGISADLSSTKFSGIYYEADVASMKKYDIYSTEQMKERTRKCFSSEYSNIIINTKLSSVFDEDDDAPISLVRYYQDTVDTEIMMVNKDAVVILKDKLEYEYETLKVLYSKGEEVYVSLFVTVTDDETEKSQRKEIEVALIEENGEWRINSPTYTTYFDRTDYDDLQNK